MSDGIVRYQQMYSPLVADVDVVAGTQNYDAALVPRGSLYTVYVQKIIIGISTHSDGKSLTFQDTANTPVPIGKYSDEVVSDIQEEAPFVFDFGPRGTPLTQGKSLDIKGSAAGLAGRIHIEAYQKLTGIGAP